MAKRKSRKPVWIGLTSAQQKKANAAYNKLKKTHKASYAKRIARGEALGKTRQATRGHKPHEHRERQRSEEEKLTDKQALEINRFYNREYNPTGYGDKERIQAEEFEAEFQEKGMKAFIAMRAMWRNLRKMWEAEGKPYKPGLYGVSEIEGFAASLGLDDARWLFYH